PPLASGMEAEAATGDDRVQLRPSGPPLTTKPKGQAMHRHLQAVSDADFTASVLESERPVVVDFWAAWCPPCRAMTPVLEELALEHPELAFVALDADANSQTVIEQGVLSMPTFLLFKGGAEVARLVGSRPKRRLAAELEEALAMVAH
ncbi:MAG: thioredoxin family protein, partial [Gaiellaceae bacterium]